MLSPPDDADARRAIAPVIVYPPDTMPPPDLAAYAAIRDGAEKIVEVVVPPRDGRAFRVNAGQFFRITSVEGHFKHSPNMQLPCLPTKLLQTRSPSTSYKRGQ